MRECRLQADLGETVLLDFVRDELHAVEKYDDSPIGPSRTLTRPGSLTKVVDRATWGRTPDAIRSQQLAEQQDDEEEPA